MDLSGHNIFTSTQAYYMIQVSLRAFWGFSSLSNRLITPLYKSIQAVKLLSMLTHDSTNHVTNGHHANHITFIDDRDVSDSVIWKEKKKKKEVEMRLE